MSNCKKLDKRTKAYKECIKAQHAKKPKGAGDIVETVLKKTGVKKIVEIFVDGKDCGCDERKEKLNKLLPLRYKARCLTEDEYKAWGEFKETRTLKINNEQIKYVCKLYASVFNRLYWEPCRSCSARPLIDMISKLDKVHSAYEN